jgi:formiminoglutamase
VFKPGGPRRVGTAIGERVGEHDRVTGPLPPPDARRRTAADWLAGGAADGAALAVLGVPTFATSRPRTGAHATPAAVRRALAGFSTWSAVRRRDLADLAAVDLGDVADPDLEVDGEWRTMHAVSSACAGAALTVVLGGDGAVTAPSVLGMAGDDLAGAGLVTLDAHHDLDDGRSGASSARRVLDAGLPGGQLAQVGIADWAPRLDGDTAASRGVTVLSRAEVEVRGVAESVRRALDVAGAGGGPVYLAVDLGVCDAAEVPGCARAVPGGLTARDLLLAVHVAAADPRVRAIDLTEVDATRDTGGRTVRLAALCLLEAAAGLAAR